MRPASLIDRRKFRKFFEEKYLRPFSVSEDDIKTFMELAELACVNVEGKFYAISTTGLSNLLELLTRLRHSGKNTIFFSPLYKTNISQFMEWGFLSPSILGQAIKKYFPYSCDNDLFRFQDDIPLEDEIFRVCCGMSIVHLDKLSQALPFVPPEILRKILKNSSKTLSAGADRFLILDAIVFEKTEEYTAKSTINKAIAEQGFFSGKSLHLPRSQELNPEVSPLLLAKVFALRCLSDSYIWQRGIICTREKSFTPDALLRFFCRNNKSFSLDNLIHLMDNLFESSDNSHFLEIARSVTVQVDEKNFVEPSAVDFDVPGTDEALALLTDGKPFPLRGVAFSLLPAIPGYRWNHYLLLSYCHLKSEKFQMLQPSSSNACTGIIFDRHLKEKNYYVLAAQIALDKGVAIRFDDVADFAFQYGLVARRRKSAISSILAAMQQVKD